MKKQLLAARRMCGGLAVLDIFLGGAAAFAPRLMMRLFAPGKEIEDVSVIRRTGALWLFFVPVQAWAALKPSPGLLRAVAVLRLQEVPADAVWVAAGTGFGWFGKMGIASAPPFNLAAGAFLLRAAERMERGGDGQGTGKEELR